jgi:hypothetical protein
MRASKATLTGVFELRYSDELLSLEALLYLLSLDESNESEYVIAINMGAYLAKKHKG